MDCGRLERALVAVSRNPWMAAFEGAEKPEQTIRIAAQDCSNPPQLLRLILKRGDRLVFGQHGAYPVQSPRGTMRIQQCTALRAP